MQVFISYKREEIAFAKEIIGYIQSWHYTYWLDIEKIEADENWDDAVHQGLQNSDVVIGLLTTKAVHSGNVLDEWGWADTNRKPLILLRLEEVPPNDISQRYVRLHYIDLVTDRSSAIEKLKTTLQKIAENVANTNKTITQANEGTNANNAPKRVKRKSTIRKLIVGAFVLIMVTTILLLIGNGCNPIPTPTRTPEPTITPEATSTSSFTPTSTIEVTSTYTATPIYTNTTLPSPTVTKSETPTYTNTLSSPTDTSTSTFTITVTRSISLTPSFTGSFPCDAYLAGISGTRVFMHIRPSFDSAQLLSLFLYAGDAVKIIEKQDSGGVWYRVVTTDGQHFGWLPGDKILPSESCPQ